MEMFDSSRLTERVIRVVERNPNTVNRRPLANHPAAGGQLSTKDVYFGCIAGSAVPGNAHGISDSNTRSIRFGIYSADEIAQHVSVLAITDVKGLADPCLGATQSAPCATCSLDYKGCPGHMGHISLPNMVINPLFSGYVLRIANLLCLFCKRLLISPQAILCMFPLRQNASSTIHSTWINARMRTITQFCGRQSQCFWCGRQRTTVRIHRMQLLLSAGPGKRDIPMSTLSLYNTLIHVPDTDYAALGIDSTANHPAHTLLLNLPVLPPVARPCSQNGTGMVTQDDITTEYHSIIQGIRMYRLDLQPQRLLDIQTAIERIFLDQNPVTNRRGNQRNNICMSIRRRWVGKTGRVRREGMGKRVNYCTRTVATCDAFLEADQVGVPYQVLHRMTQPLMVQAYNLSYVNWLMRHGQVQFIQRAGASNPRHISFLAEQTLTLLLDDTLLRNGRKYGIRHGTPPIPYTSRTFPVSMTTMDNRVQIRVCFGDRILRSTGRLINPARHIIWPPVHPGDLLLITPQCGDYVLFNRQPTLVEESMTAMRLVPLPIQSFASNCAAVEALRGDYDGDEINIHFPQTPQTTAELQQIMSLRRQIVTAQASKPVVKLIHDSVVTAYFLTRKTGAYKRPYTLPKAQWQQLCAGLPLSLGDVLVRQEEMRRSYLRLCAVHPRCFAAAAMTWEQYRYTGMALLSVFLPPDAYFHQEHEHTTLMNIYLQHNHIPRDQCRVAVFQGCLYNGVLDSNLLNGKHGLVHHLYINHGSQAAARFISCMQILTANVTMTLYSLSINLDDCRLPAPFLAECNVARKEAIEQALAQEHGTTVTTGHLQAGTPFLDKLINVQRVNEERIIRMLSRNRRVDGMPNHMLLLTILGSKGSISNVLQTTYCLGQQVIQGGRVEPEWNGRFFPHCNEDKEDLVAHIRTRGLVYSRNFYMGLSPVDFFVHAMAGREALVEGATSTAQSGYAMRLAMKLLEHNTTQYDMTVRNQNNKIIQFLYAGDGFDRRFACGSQCLDAVAHVHRVLHNTLYV